MDVTERPEQVIEVKEPFVTLEATRAFRGKTAGYWREQTTILRILDRAGRQVAPVWETEWRESAPGIETRAASEVSRTRAGDTPYETVVDECVRIHRHACPVRVQFQHQDEYIDYDDCDASSSFVELYWVRCEA
jgi:hypothetical protein